MFGSFLPSALGCLVASKIYSATGADIVMESITLIEAFGTVYFPSEPKLDHPEHGS
jgi:hypothetical protein